MIIVLVQLATETPWGPELAHSYRVVSSLEAERLEAQATDPESFITGVVRVPSDLLLSWQQIVGVHQ
jgi:hypothetical protein